MTAARAACTPRPPPSTDARDGERPVPMWPAVPTCQQHTKPSPAPPTHHQRSQTATSSPAASGGPAPRQQLPVPTMHAKTTVAHAARDGEACHAHVARSAHVRRHIARLAIAPHTRHRRTKPHDVVHHRCTRHKDPLCRSVPTCCVSLSSSVGRVPAHITSTRGACARTRQCEPQRAKPSKRNPSAHR